MTGLSENPEGSMPRAPRGGGGNIFGVRTKATWSAG